ncbi:MAG TPA: proline dehydrogenase family protein [bacterium]|jgi:proline dehydrogenase|nr:proline dehydrogenase [Myxococcales bacterium]OQA62266.1 MAG: Proline dehydrogenase 1 [bacterium ADurb.Bin270]HPW45139.1 proline dehydrogenase family protein [bacterium]HQC50319.1 proline dehydrogenase family protein [bacterium]HQG12902.1 proline dehydrogenase family protein [bacterium]
MRLGSALSKIAAPLTRRFRAGTTLKEALDCASKLSREGFLFTLDHLGEHVSGKREADAATELYVVLLKALKEYSLPRNISLKLSQLGMGVDSELCLKNLERIVNATEELKGFVRVDMENSASTDVTLRMIKSAHKNRLTPVGAVLQAKLKRTPDDLLSMLESGISVRLCKGVYDEPTEIAFQSRSDIRREFLALAKRLLTSDMTHGIATHDEFIIDEVKKFILSNGIEKSSFEFQMLLGIRIGLAKKLLAEGWKVRIYIPFGKAWLPYTIRRIREIKNRIAISDLFRRDKRNKFA